MTVSEFTFLALGLVLGVASGVAFIEIIRARPPARGEVRLTVAQDAVPRRRPATLADDAFVVVGPEPARGGPADRRMTDLVTPLDAPERRTNVQSQGGPAIPGGTSVPGAVPIRPDRGPVVRMGLQDPASAARPQAALVGIRVSSGEDPTLSDLRASNAAAAARTAATAAAAAVAPAGAQTTEATGAAAATAATAATAAIAATAAPPMSRTAVALLEPTPSTPAVDGPPAASTDHCAEERRVADERCELANRARARADGAAEQLRAAQRTYESHESAAADAAANADPRTIQTAKEFAQRNFRLAERAAADPGTLEDAARDWLHEINRINAHLREATATVTRERGAASAIGETLERLSRDADLGRVAAGMAEAACTAARAALAECDERRAVRPTSFQIAPAPAVAVAEDWLKTDETLGIAMEAGTAPRIFGMLRGDRAAMTTLVSELSADNPEQAPHWLRLLTALVDSIVADAIDASALIFPADHPFWSKFSEAQARDIARALASLGCRFDGQGGWADDRVPSQRDLSLAVGYAGLDPMRVRRWPDPQAIELLFSDVQVAADEYVANNAGDLTLAEMVTMLGRRADALAELWNRWGTIRPLLLQNA